jgi:hypothetical protein
MKSTNSAPKTTYGSFNQVLYEMGLQKIEDKRTDEKFQEQKRKEESRYLSKVSKILITLWDLTALIMKTPTGKQLVIDAETGRIYRGSVSLSKLELLPEKVPGRVSLTIDGDGRNEKILSGSSVVSGGSVWKKSVAGKTRIAPDENSENPVVWMFNEFLKTVSKEDVTINHIEDYTFKYDEIFIKDYPVGLGIARSTGKVHYVIIDGKKENI